jgi:uncharacterized protein YpmS
VLKYNDYVVSVNATLSGQKIDYEEKLDFVLKDTEKSLSYWGFALLALVLLALTIIITEIVRSGKRRPSSVSSSKSKSRKSSTTSAKTNQDLSDINKELAEMRKNINKKMSKLKR